jgi:hypothetical protein
VASGLVSFKVIKTAATVAHQDIARLDGCAHRAVMWSLREAGRQVKREARKKAPKYNGPDTRAVPGRLRASIKSPRRLKQYGPHDFGIVIGPRGEAAIKYAQKIEERDHYMQQAYATVVPKVRGIHARAMDKALLKYGPR